MPGPDPIRHKDKGAIVERIGKYLSVSEVPPISERKTLMWELLSSGGDTLGSISWYGPWRCYTVNPFQGTTFNAECLRDLARFLDAVRNKRKGGDRG
jgi:hypothetical protein